MRGARRSRMFVAFSATFAVALLTQTFLLARDDDNTASRGERMAAIQPQTPTTEFTTGAALHAALLRDGEMLGGASEARIAIVMPVRDGNLPAALRNVESWSVGRRPPCATASGPAPDFAFLHAQSFASEAAARSAVAIDATMRQGRAHCVRAIRFLAAQIPLSLDVYTVTPTHNFSGPNRHFLAAFRVLMRLKPRGLATYDAFQLMETDTYPLVPGWASAIAALAAPPLADREEHGRGAPWVRGGISLCLSPADDALPKHVNGNALYRLRPATFADAMRHELRQRIDRWAFDVLLGRWLFAQHKSKVVPSEHVLSLSSFQRSRTCCEIVAALVGAPDRGGGAVVLPGRTGVLLLHTGNVGKMPDDRVHPAMRTLGRRLQELFVPRESTSCAALLSDAEHSTLPQQARERFAPIMPWRARLKAVGGSCAAPDAPPPPHWWVPSLSLIGRAAAASLMEAAAMGRGWGMAGGASLYGTLDELLAEAARDGGNGHVVVALLQPPLQAAWDAYLSHRFPRLASAALGAPSASTRLGQGSANEYAREEALRALSREAAREVSGEPSLSSEERAERRAWAGSLKRNPLVCALSGTTKRAGCEGAGKVELHAAIRVLRDRTLVVPLGDSAAASAAVKTVSRYFGWDQPQAAGERLPSDSRNWLGDQPLGASLLGGAKSPPVWLEEAVIGGQGGGIAGSLALDDALHREAIRLAYEQQRSVVWEEPAEGDLCSVAETAGAVREFSASTPVVINKREAFEFDGDGSRVFVFPLQPPLNRSVALLLRGRSLLGGCRVSARALISHRASSPSAATHEFRFNYESKPPHDGPGARFTLPESRIRKCCDEAEAARRERGEGPGCGSDGRPLVLWIAIKYRATMRSRLELTAVYRNRDT